MPAAIYGHQDTTFQSCGGEVGIRALVHDFYNMMSGDPAYTRIWSWHTKERRVTEDKLACFLCGWMGGPALYQEKYGRISIPGSHQHLNVTELERDMWLSCMAGALALQDYPEDLVSYLLIELAKPAEMIRRTSQAQRKASP